MVSSMALSGKHFLNAAYDSINECCMARELDLAPDHSPILPDHLATHQMPVGEAPVTSMEVLAVQAQSPYQSVAGPREYNVEVEFQPDEVGLDDMSFKEYLDSYQNAHIAQDVMASLIRRHLCEALNLDDVFVEVHRTAPANKKTRIGKP